MGSIDVALIGCQLSEGSCGQEVGEDGGLNGAYTLVFWGGWVAGRPSNRAGYRLVGRNFDYLGDQLGGWLLSCESSCSLCCLEGWRCGSKEVCEVGYDPNYLGSCADI